MMLFAVLFLACCVVLVIGSSDIRARQINGLSCRFSNDN